MEPRPCGSLFWGHSGETAPSLVTRALSSARAAQSGRNIKGGRWPETSGLSFFLHFFESVEINFLNKFKIPDIGVECITEGPIVRNEPQEVLAR